MGQNASKKMQLQREYNNLKKEIKEIESNIQSRKKLQNISLKGTQNTTYANIDTLNNIVYNTNEKQFLPTIYSSATPATEAATTIQEIYSCIPTLAIKQTLNINNQNY